MALRFDRASAVALSSQCVALGSGDAGVICDAGRRQPRVTIAITVCTGESIASVSLLPLVVQIVEAAPLRSRRLIADLPQVPGHGAAVREDGHGGPWRRRRLRRRRAAVRADGHGGPWRRRRLRRRPPYARHWYRSRRGNRVGVLIANVFWEPCSSVVERAAGGPSVCILGVSHHLGRLYSTIPS